MNRLSFENIEVVNTPLSSLRSCSEYQRANSHKKRKAAVGGGSNDYSYWSSIWSWNFLIRKRRKQRVRFADTEDWEKEFMVERLRFNSSNLAQGEDFINHSSPDRLLSRSTDVIGRKRLCSSETDAGDSRPAGRSFLREASWFVDYCFGFNTAVSCGPRIMEIELKNLRPPQLLTVYGAGAQGEADREPSAPTAGIRRVTSLRSLERIDERAEVRQTVPSSSGAGSISISEGILLAGYNALLSRLRGSYRGDELFYESIRIQPFSSGAYLRGMLLAGMSSLFFQIYNLLSWPAQAAPLSTFHAFVEHLLFLNLCMQILLNVLSLPNRLRIHFQCWEASRAVEVDGAIRLIRAMLSSDSWLVNKLLGQALDLLALANIVATELYLWLSARDDALHSLMVSLCATNLLMFVCRVVVATVYSLSMHDPAVLSEARKRGLSKWDLEVLPTFVFTSREEVNNPDCSICLGCFDMGEMLCSLPCDKKHSFHACCIRQWLQRQNSCPLCQKLV